MVAFLYIANVALNGEPHLGIGPEYGFFASFSIPTGAFVLGLCAFYSAAGRRVPQLRETRSCLSHTTRCDTPCAGTL